MVTISVSMVAALEDASAGRLGSWEYGSGTLGALKRRGWVKNTDTTVRGRIYRTTPEGENALARLRQGLSAEE